MAPDLNPIVTVEDPDGRGRRRKKYRPSHSSMIAYRDAIVTVENPDGRRRRRKSPVIDYQDVAGCHGRVV